MFVLFAFEAKEEGKIYNNLHTLYNIKSKIFYNKGDWICRQEGDLTENDVWSIKQSLRHNYIVRPFHKQVWWKRLWFSIFKKKNKK